MNLLQTVKDAFSKLGPKRTKTVYISRSFEAAQNSRLNFSWGNQLENINRVFAVELQSLKARSRDLVQNSAFSNAYLNLMRKNVVGSEGITLSNKAVRDDGKPDAYANDVIKTQWDAWCKNPTVTKSISMTEVLGQTVDCLSSDGEAIWILHDGFKNKHGFAIEVVDTMNLDPTLTMTLTNGNKVICGVEFDKFRAPQNFYFRTPYSLNLQPETYTIVPADKVRFISYKKSTDAVRGYPPLAPVMNDLKILDGYIESELVAARMGAAKVGFYESTGEVAGTPDEVDSQGYEVSQLEPGTLERLPLGTKFTGFDPQHPTTAFPYFIKAMFKVVCSALGLSYNAVIGDYEATSYSSMRAAALSDRETYKSVQQMLIEGLLYPTFEKWLAIQLLNKNVNLPFVKLAKFNQPTFLAKKWASVDPTKDIETAKIELELNLTSRTRYLAERGQEFQDVLNEREAEEAALKEAGLPTVFDLNQPVAPPTGPDPNHTANPNSEANGAQ